MIAPTTLRILKLRIMEDDEREKLTEESNVLRQELKSWEREFAAANDGRKAGREDIKQHSIIGTSLRVPIVLHSLTSIVAQKYKDYNRTRDILAGKLPPPKPASQYTSKPTSKFSEAASPRPPKRKPPSSTHATPSKRQSVEPLQTPSQRHLHPSALDPYDSPSTIRMLFSPRKPLILGPTPQKDGKLLGIFDLMPSGDEDSPFKPPRPPASTAASVQATPRKGHSVGAEIMATPSAARHPRTPLSSSKRFLLDTFVTPLKLRRGSNDGSAKRSISKLNFSTPSFLRRDNRVKTLPAIPEAAADTASPPAPRLPKRPLVRGLSSILAGLREMQEEALDDDLDALREMEDDQQPPQATQQHPMSKPQLPKPKERVHVEDSQQVSDFPFMDFPDLDFNRDVEDAEEGFGEKEQAMVDRDSKLPVYKKKGQKRTTRKVNMKPVRAKVPARKASPAEYSDDEDEEGNWQNETPDQDGDGEGRDAVPDTQQGFEADSLPLYAAKRNFDSESEGGTEYTASEGGTRYKRSRVVAEGRKTKVGVQAHMNYKRMKLRNTGAKGGKVGGRFSRRR